MAKHTNKINERVREIFNMECENRHDISEDLDELLDGDFIDFKRPIHTYGYESKWYDVYGITYMAVTDEDGEIINELPAFYTGDERHMLFVEQVPYEVALNVYRTVLDMMKQS